MLDEHEYQIDHDQSERDTEAQELEQPAETGGVDLGQVRELVLAAHPDVVPEMIQGTTFDELMASVDPARSAYQRIAEEASRARPAPRVAAQPGHRSVSMADLDSLSSLGKISEGLRRSG
jgi:hypothetical protein